MNVLNPTGLLAVQARIAELQGRFAAPRATAASPGAEGVAAAASSFGAAAADAASHAGHAHGASHAGHAHGATAPPTGDEARWTPHIRAAAERHGLDPKLLTALVRAESGFKATAVSHAGAIGLAQLMPPTAARFGVKDINDPAENLEGGARYLAWLIRRYDGNLPLAVAAYNAGEGAVDRHRGIPPYRETQVFVRRVLRKAGMSHLLTGRTATTAGSAPPAPPPRVERGDGDSVVLTNVPRR